MSERLAKVRDKHIIDYSRKPKQLTSFDEECRKILQIDESERDNLIAEDKYFKKLKDKQIIDKLSETDYSELVDNLMKTQKVARKKSQNAYQSNLCRLNNAEIASNKLTQNRQEELTRLSKQGISSESKPFSNAMQVLSVNKECLWDNQKIVILKPTAQNRKFYGKSSSFSIREIQRKLKHSFGVGTRKEPNLVFSYSSSVFAADCIARGVDVRCPSSSSTTVKTKEDLGSKQDNLKFPKRKKKDFSSGRLSKKQEVDVVLEANRLLSERILKNDAIAMSGTGNPSPKTLERILSTPENDYWPFRRRRDSIMRFSTSNGRQKSCLSTLRTNVEVTSCNEYREYNDAIESSSTEMSSSPIQRTDEKAQDTIISATRKIKSNGETTIENGAFTKTYHLDMPENIKYHEEHQSPVSVLEQIFTEDADTPSTIMLQTDKQRLKPRRLHFEECSFDSPINEQDYISNYIHLVFKASCLSWDKLSKTSSQSQELLNSSLFDELKFLPCDSGFDPKLIFDHMNEVLLKIHRTHLGSPFTKLRICFAPLEELVVDEMLREAADFHLLQTEETTLDQLVAKDLTDSRLGIDFRVETEHIIIDISEEILEQYVLDVILGFGE